MKKTLIALAAILALTLAPRPAAALGDKEAAILGGLIGGVIIGAAIDDALDHDNHVSVSYSHRDRDDRGRDHRDRGRDDRYDRRDDHRGGHHYDRGGSWSYRTVKVWIPKRTYYTYDHCGNRIRHHERGYWTYRKEKVWVPARGRW